MPEVRPNTLKHLNHWEPLKPMETGTKQMVNIGADRNSMIVLNYDQQQFDMKCGIVKNPISPSDSFLTLK